MEMLQHRLLHGHQASKDSDFIATIAPTMSSLARYHSAASPEASAALLADPKTQQLTFPMQGHRVFLRRRFGVPIPQIPLRRCTCKPKPELERLGTHLICVCLRAGSALSLMTPWPFVCAVWLLGKRWLAVSCSVSR